MKQITQERLVSAIKNINDALSSNSTMQRYTSIVKTLAFQGLQYATGEKTTELDAAKFTAEMTYWDAPKTTKELATLSEKWEAKINHYHGKRQQVWRLQATHNVSGLTWVPANFNPSFSFPWVHEELNLIESDLAILNEWKPKVLENWIHYAMLDCCSVHRYKDGNFHNSSFSELLLATSFYQWAHTWKVEGHSLNIVLGNGLDTESIDSETVWFSAIMP